MWKVLCVVFIFAVPLLCGPIEGGKRKTAIQSILDQMWTEKCMNVSGITIDINRNDQLYSDFQNCTETAVNINELGQDCEQLTPGLDLRKIEELSEKQKIGLVAMSKKYCPKANASLGCEDILSPIYAECYDSDELAGRMAVDGMYRGIHNFLCQNESDAVSLLIDGKVIECALAKKDEVIGCYQAYALSNLKIDETTSLFSMLPRAGSVCRSVDSFGRCLAPLFNQCKLSQTAGDIVRSLFTQVMEASKCQKSASVNDIETVHRSPNRSERTSAQES